MSFFLNKRKIYISIIILCVFVFISLKLIFGNNNLNQKKLEEIIINFNLRNILVNVDGKYKVDKNLITLTGDPEKYVYILTGQTKSYNIQVDNPTTKNCALKIIFQNLKICSEKLSPVLTLKESNVDLFLKGENILETNFDFFRLKRNSKILFNSEKNSKLIFKNLDRKLKIN